MQDYQARISQHKKSPKRGFCFDFDVDDVSGASLPPIESLTDSLSFNPHRITCEQPKSPKARRTLSHYKSLSSCKRGKRILRSLSTCGFECQDVNDDLKLAKTTQEGLDTMKTDGILDRFTVNGRIGRGAYSVVYHAVCNDTQENVAIKYIPKAKLSPAQISRIRSEISILKTIRKQGGHPHLLQYIQAMESKSSIYIVTELIEGGDLFDCIAVNNRLPEQDARLIFQALAKAVSRLHELGITHRDLKPENVFLSCSDNQLIVRLGDFGLARCYNNKNRLSYSPCGTPTYCAPEIFTNNGKGYLPSVDVWSLGVILYTMVCGFPPFQADNDDDIVEKVSSSQFYFPEDCDLSDQLKSLIIQLLQKEPKRRPCTSDILAHPWVQGY